VPISQVVEYPLSKKAREYIEKNIKRIEDEKITKTNFILVNMIKNQGKIASFLKV